MSLNFENYQKDANTWLNQVAISLGIEDREQAGRIFRAVLHALRDRMPAQDAVQLGTQLPIIWKGIYFHGFKLRNEPIVIRDEREWLEFIRSKNPAAEHDFPTLEHTAYAFRDVMKALEELIDIGQYMHIEQALNFNIREMVKMP